MTTSLKKFYIAPAKLACLFVLSLGFVSLASSRLTVSLQELCTKSTLIVQAEVESVTATPNALGETASRTAVLKISKIYKGTVDSETVSVRLFGGFDSLKDSAKDVFPGFSDLIQGDRGIFLLQNSSIENGKFQIVGGDAGWIELRRLNGGTWTATRSVGSFIENASANDCNQCADITGKQTVALDALEHYLAKFSANNTHNGFSVLTANITHNDTTNTMVAASSPSTDKGNFTGTAVFFVVVVLVIGTTLKRNAKTKPALIKIGNLLILVSLGGFFALFLNQSQNAQAYHLFRNKDSQAYHWNVSGLENGSVKWYVSSNAPSDLQEAAASVFPLWTNAVGGNLKFEFAGAAAEKPLGEPCIFLDWDATGEKIPDSLYLAYTTFRSSGNGVISSAKIVVNAKSYRWRRSFSAVVSAPDADGIREATLEPVLLHEIGHALGLHHADMNQEAVVGGYDPSNPPTMNSVILPGAGDLHVDDIEGARALYGKGSETTHLPQTGTEDGPSEGTVKYMVQFTFSGGGKNPKWDFGDGSTESGNRIIHTFTVPGVYQVTVEGHKGRTGEVEVNVPTSEELEAAAKAKKGKKKKKAKKKKPVRIRVKAKKPPKKKKTTRSIVADDLF